MPKRPYEVNDVCKNKDEVISLKRQRVGESCLSQEEAMDLSEATTPVHDNHNNATPVSFMRRQSGMHSSKSFPDLVKAHQAEVEKNYFPSADGHPLPPFCF